MDFCTPHNSALVGYDLVPVQSDRSIYQELAQTVSVQWAQPHLEEAAQWMRRLVDQPQLGQQLGQQALQTVVAWTAQDRSQVFGQLETLYLSDSWRYRGRLSRHWLLRERLRAIPRHLTWRWPWLAPGFNLAKRLLGQRIQSGT